MNDDYNENTQESNRTTERPPVDATRRSSLPGAADIPRRGYERRRDAKTGRRMPPPNPDAATPPPVYKKAPPPPGGNSGGARPGSPPPPIRGNKRAPRDSGLYLPWWSLVILVTIVGGVSCGLLAFVMNLGSAVLAEQTPQVIIVTGQLDAAQPTSINFTPSPLPTEQLVPTQSAQTAEPSRTPLPGECVINEEVIVYGTGGVGLNLRDRPGGEVSFIAPEGERMLIIDGPQYLNDITWCQVRSLAQNSSFGWASLDYMIDAEAVDTP